MRNDKLIVLGILLVSALVIISSIYYKYTQYDPAKSGLLVYTWQVGQLPLGFTHFSYQPDSMIYLDIVQRIYKYGLVGYFTDPSISGSWGNFRYYMVVIFGRPASHAVNLFIYTLWQDPYALLVMPLLTGVLSVGLFYYILRELGLSQFRSGVGTFLFLINKYFLFETGEALFDVPALFFGFVAIYVWLRSKRTGNDKWVGATQLFALLYRQSNVIVFVSCLIWDYLNGRLKDKKWYVLPLIATLLLIPIYLFHLIGGWTFFTPGLIEVEYHGSIMTKPIYFASTWMIAFGILGIISVIGFFCLLFRNKFDFSKKEMVIPIYLALVWLFNFAWAINMGRFWLIAVLPVIYLSLKMYDDFSYPYLLLILAYVTFIDYSYSIVAVLGGGWLT